MGLEALGLDADDITELENIRFLRSNFKGSDRESPFWDKIIAALKRLEKAEAGRLTSTVLIRAVDGHFLEAHAGDILIVLPKEVRGE